MIKLVNCNKTYIKNNNKIEVLKDVNYNFSMGKFYAIMGKSGSGKSTLLNLMAGLLKPDNGSIIINNKDICKMNNNDISKVRNTEIGLVYQSFLLNNEMTSKENVKLPTYINKNIKKSEVNKRVEELLKSLNLENRINHYPKELSGGEQQRVAIARALINNPSVILADEPTGNLDKTNEIQIFEIFKELSKNKKCVIVVSHNEEIKKYADVVLYLKDGGLYEK